MIQAVILSIFVYKPVKATTERGTSKEVPMSKKIENINCLPYSL